MKPQRGKTPKKKYGFSGVTVTEPVEVYCRIKPINDPDKICLKNIGENQVQLIQDLKHSHQREYIYTFQQVFDDASSQKQVFDTVALPLVEDVISGKNGLLFTYGVTGSGKTYTMTGSPKDQGILPRCLDVIFNTIGSQQAKKYVFQSDHANGFNVQSEADAMAKLQDDIMPSTSTIPKTPKREKSEFVESRRLRDTTKVAGINNKCLYAVFLSYIEIYNNGIFDLLEELACDPITGYKAPQSKILREDSNKMMYVHCCTEVEVKSPDEAFNVIYAGQNRRKVARTALNETSSRSHSVFNIRVVQAPLDDRGEEVIKDDEPVCVSQLSLVDLAGSERAVRTKNQGDRLKEAANINNTLMVLRNCIDILRENQKLGTSKIVPYRDSKLTHLFKTYLEGDGKVRMIVCVNPITDESGETLHVMKFAEMTREVTVQRQEGQLCFPEPITYGRLYPNLDKEPEKGYSSGSSETGSGGLQTVGIYDMGPPFPTIDLIHPSNDSALRELDGFLQNRINLRKKYRSDAKIECDKFRKLLLHVEKENAQISVLEREVQRLQKENSRLRHEHSQTDKTVYDLQNQLQAANAEMQELERKLQNKSMQTKLKNEKIQLKAVYENKLQMTREKYERDMEYEKQKMERHFGARYQEKIRKLNLLKSIVNEPSSDTSTSNTNSTPSTTPRHTMKLRTFTAPATAPKPAPAPRRPVGKLPMAKSMHDLHQIGAPHKSVQTSSNPKHRRSKSSSNAEIWLEHKARNQEIDTVLQPKLKKKRSVSRLTEKDTKDVNKYCLNHQEVGSDGELCLKFYKGNVAPTVTGGCTMVFDEVEEVKCHAPGSDRKRHSSCSNIPERGNNGHWTDTEERCSYAINGYGNKKIKAFHV